MVLYFGPKVLRVPLLIEAYLGQYIEEEAGIGVVDMEGLSETVDIVKVAGNLEVDEIAETVDKSAEDIAEQVVLVVHEGV